MMRSTPPDGKEPCGLVGGPMRWKVWPAAGREGAVRAGRRADAMESMADRELQVVVDDDRRTEYDWRQPAVPAAGHRQADCRGSACSPGRPYVADLGKSFHDMCPRRDPVRECPGEDGLVDGRASMHDDRAESAHRSVDHGRSDDRDEAEPHCIHGYEPFVPVTGH